MGHVISCDVTSQSDVDELGKVVTRIANEKNLSLWAVVNNAGIAEGCLIDWTPVEMYQRIMDVNYFGIIRVIKATLELLKMTKNSRIINLSSLAGLAGTSTLGGYCGMQIASWCDTSFWTHFLNCCMQVANTLWKASQSHSGTTWEFSTYTLQMSIPDSWGVLLKDFQTFLVRTYLIICSQELQWLPRDPWMRRGFTTICPNI